MLQPHEAHVDAYTWRERGAHSVTAQAAAKVRRRYGAHQLILREAKHGNAGEGADAQPRRWDGRGEVVVPLRLHRGLFGAPTTPRCAGWAAQPYSQARPPL